MAEITPPEIEQSTEATQGEVPTTDVATEDPINEFAGVPHGTVIQTPEGEPNEVIVNEYDEDGNVIAWHKAPEGSE